MKPQLKDYIYTGVLLTLILVATLGTLRVLDDAIARLLGPLYAPIAMAVAFLAIYGLYSCALLRLLQRLHPLRPGSYRVGHPQFTLWKVRHVLTVLAKASLTPFFPVFVRQGLYALLGAKVGKHVAVAGDILDPVLTTLEDGAIVGEGAIITGHLVARGRFILGRVHIGKGVTVGGGAGILPNVHVGDKAVIAPGACIESDTEVGPGELWAGLPATCIRGRRGAER